MKLRSFKVTNYRNVRDSNSIEVGNITAFVGQNEAGKSNLFEALSGLTRLYREKRITSTRTGPSMIGATRIPEHWFARHNSP